MYICENCNKIVPPSDKNFTESGAVVCEECQKEMMEDNQYNGMTQEELDDLVHDAKSTEAACINNEGRDAQIAYLLGIR